jgi:formyl-CoA transferase
MGGLRYVSGDPSTPPSRMGISIGDQLAAMHACMGALMAIHARERTGKGQVVDSAIYESVLNMMESLVTEHDVAGYTRERTGAIIPNVAPSNIFETKDEQMILIGANQDRVFSRLCDVMDAPELASDERYKSHTARGRNQTQLDDLINEWTKSKTLKEVEDLCNKNGIPAGLIYRAKDMIDDPHFKARKAIIDIEHPVFGMIKMQNVAPKLSENPGEVCKVGPELGEHNNYVFKKILKKSEKELITLEKNGVI